jgi:hypothetical protein
MGRSGPAGVDIDGECSVCVGRCHPCPAISKDDELGDEEREACGKNLPNHLVDGRVLNFLAVTKGHGGQERQNLSPFWMVEILVHLSSRFC